MKYMLMMSAPRGTGDYEIFSWKPEAIQVADLSVKYVGFDIPNEFVVGYGLDYRQRYRNLPFVGTLARHVYE